MELGLFICLSIIASQIRFNCWTQATAAAKHLYKDYETSKLIQKTFDDGSNSTANTEEMDITVIETGVSDHSIARKISPQALLCEPYNEDQLYVMLESVGAYNQRFMANSIDEIVRFPELYRNNENFLMHDAVDVDQASLTNCNDECQRIKREFDRYWAEWLIKQDYQISTGNETDDNSSNETTAKTDQTTEGCKLETFFPLGPCEERGSENELLDHQRLCTACHGVYLLNKKCFPRYFNAVKCNKSDRNCIYDWWGKSAHGKCDEKKLSFLVLHNVGTEDCPLWKYYSINVPTSCECYLNKMSWLRA